MKLTTKNKNAGVAYVEATKKAGIVPASRLAKNPLKLRIYAGSPYIIACPRRYLSAIFDEFLLYILATILAMGFIKQTAPGVAAESCRTGGHKK